MSTTSSRYPVVITSTTCIDDITAVELSEVSAEVSRLNAMCHTPVVEEFNAVYTDDDVKLADITPIVHVSCNGEGVANFRNRKELNDHIDALLDVADGAWDIEDNDEAKDK